MANFLVQSVNNRIKHDFCFGMLEAVNYQNWYHGNDVHSYIIADEIPKGNEMKHYIPCGTIEFVYEFLKIHHGIDNVKPVNIPESLMSPDFLKRKVELKDKKDIEFNGKTFFVKSMDKIKGFADFVSKPEHIPEGAYQISEVIKINSEWRAFVYNNELVGLNNYVGDFTKMPDIELIKQMIKEYKDAPPAYTLDVGLNREGTFLIEVHEFYSCGLYGFNNGQILPQMIIRGFNYLLKKYS
jgi:hypothetical protein